MKFCIFSIFSAALFVAGVSAQITINTPTNVIVCEPLQITFTGGTGPFIISYSFTLISLLLCSYVTTFSITPGATPDGTPLATFNGVTSSPFTWAAVNYPAGTSLGLTIRDSTGLTAQSASFTVISGGSTSCLNGTASGSSGPAASTGASSPTTGAATATGTTPASASSGSNSGNSGSSSSTSKAASPSSSGNAAVVAAIPYSVAGVLGVVIAAVFV